MWSRKGVYMKKKSSKLSKLERSRYSVFYELGVCMYCGSTYHPTIHEIFEGRNRQNSMKYGLTLPLCLECHRKLQDNKEFQDHWKQKAQSYFEEHIGTHDEFMGIFRRNYK